MSASSSQRLHLALACLHHGNPWKERWHWTGPVGRHLASPKSWEPREPKAIQAGRGDPHPRPSVFERPKSLVQAASVPQCRGAGASLALSCTGIDNCRICSVRHERALVNVWFACKTQGAHRSPLHVLQAECDIPQQGSKSEACASIQAQREVKPGALDMLVLGPGTKALLNAHP